MNEVKAFVATDPAFASLYHAYPSRENYKGVPANAVLVNVWNWDPRWRVKVTKNGELTSSFRTIPSHHLFMVVASSATSTLEIEVEDAFGNVCRETMERPRAFVLE